MNIIQYNREIQLENSTFKISEAASELIKKFHQSADGLTLQNWKALSEILDYASAAEQTIADQKEMISNLESIAATDLITGLMNRLGFENEIIHAIARAKRYQEASLFVYIDLDNFKLINDQMGHQTGDEVLIIISNQLKDLVNTNDLVASLGGDEFAIWFDGISAGDVEKALSPINQNQSLFSKFSPDPSRPFSLSIGKAEVKGSANETLSQIIAKADAAMYVHKRSKKQNQ